MSWLKNIFGGSSEKSDIVEVSSDSDITPEMLAFAYQSMDRYMQKHEMVETREKDFYCGICGWSPISSFPHNH